ncbi:Vacuolar protein sorting-associated protein 8 homolog [Mytilus edulis]|uniref:Vacuolar protein sorting-associated protein 8 homolog n=1 Tax=Mytilus edulis TaxID=6550 RepID=A0A8S3RAI5_MYTED|nr:Vacuolar protein sorting-associated protein 8 homolog [Mytilus edulis]
MRDFTTPLEELLTVLRSAVDTGKQLTDNQIKLGNKLLVYISCCLAGRAYPLGDIPEDLVSDVKNNMFHCITSLHSKNHTSEEPIYPHLRTLLQFDTREFLNVLALAFEEEEFNTEEGLNCIFSVATKRVSELAQHRVPHQYKHDRPSPIWPVRQTALEQEASERIHQLSMHKNAHPQHAYDRTAYIEVSPGAKRAASTERIEMLSRPKMRQDRFGMDETEWGQYFPVSDAAKKATASGRIESLAESKRYHAMFQNEKPVQWPVDDGAMKAIASLEIQKLARPRSRTMIKDDYDPYKVPMAARRARATPRLDELCVPLPRKSRAKKAA